MRRFSAEDAPDSHGVIGAAMNVHAALGPGFLEAVDHGALAIDLRKRSIPFAREVSIPVVHEGELAGAPYRADLVVPPNLLIELKAVACLGRIEEAQVTITCDRHARRVAAEVRSHVPAGQEAFQP